MAPINAPMSSGARHTSRASEFYQKFRLVPAGVV